MKHVNLAVCRVRDDGSRPTGFETAEHKTARLNPRYTLKRDILVRTIILCAAYLIISNPAARAQDNISQTTFEVASVKRSDPKTVGSPPNFCRGGPGTADPGLLVCTNAVLGMLVSRAYNLQFYQLISPDWMLQGGSESGYEVTAKIPAGTTAEQFRLMLQYLLADRFHLTVHRETRTMPRYSLKFSKAVPTLKRSSEPAPPGPLFAQNFVNGHLQYAQHNLSLKTFTGFLSTQLSAPVADESGLTGDYDFSVEFMPDERWRGFQPATASAGSEPVPDLFLAIQNQLGLKLEAQKGPVEVVVVDHADKAPVAN